MTQAIGAYREVVVSPEFRELERLRFEALSNEASALANAERREREKWQGVVTDLRGEVAGKDAEIEQLRKQLAESRAEK